MDGSLSQQEHEGLHIPGYLLPTTELLDTEKCTPESITAGVPGSKCSNDVKFGRLVIFSPNPTFLETTDILLSNAYGSEVLLYTDSQVHGHDPGYMAVIPLNIVYNLTWLASLSTSLSNISYNIIVRGLGVDDYVIITQTLAHRPDVTSVGSVSVERNASDILDDPSSANTGDYAFVYDTTLLYIVKGDSVDETIAVTTSQCLIPGCAPPPPTTQRPLTPLGRPENGTVLWSEPSTWPNNQVPVEGQDVTLNGSSMYVILDVMNISLGLLAIRDGAVLDVSDEMDHTIELDLMIIDGGAFVAGYEEQPFAHKLTILLAGEISTPEYIQGPFAPVVGAKAIGVFGDLILNAVTSTVSWTLLLETAHNGSDLIVLTDSVDWVQGQLIVITSTSYDAYQTEVFEIAEVSSDGTYTPAQQNTHVHTPGGHSRTLFHQS